jgi:hypothetical protein
MLNMICDREKFINYFRPSLEQFVIFNTPILAMDDSEGYAYCFKGSNNNENSYIFELFFRGKLLKTIEVITSNNKDKKAILDKAYSTLKEEILKYKLTIDNDSQTKIIINVEGDYDG